MNKIKESLNKLKVEPKVIVNVGIIGFFTGVFITAIYYMFVK